MPQSEPTAGVQSAEAAPAGPIIRFDKVVKRYGDNVVLRELDFTVDPGERVTLIGPSGSGKTTILRLLMTLETVDGGVIWVDGDPLSHMERNGKLVKANEAHLRRVRSRIGMVFQQFNLFPNMNVRRNITEGPIHSLGVSKDEANQRAEELLELVGLSDKIDAHPTQLSGGQQQRVAIARALAMRPQILLLDEVTSALDPELVAGVLDVLRDIAQSTDITMLCVTHEMSFARDVSHRVLMFDHGQIAEEGTPERIFGDPQQERTRTFLKAVLEHG
ncbi:ectoine/hydroxyectoine ABC transporter ATP-binding protein EhuA [Streptomonospora nanhaiensis]|uniref:Polar amino acid transport system ATP-binding protein n=1 Tax=Streptomonospora nanhaiensis TaxID=1323731 RepID=A0A853BQW3_9ACTN|nr:ectoine/hydroxyectoine ABC transporter ATP-binding protein EhuA [Streptomonospora nanhaiensis]MBV2367058.1 ectoine/hydroxyectoine ABC transporter ATP-binding protein EhuA [Streptomonospora nanhaiensis]MBX9387229.1 ectoine/hydroxyectoine ABC transporter ATP-binding protein EhuA [Streptomonospora nanhaiensis]NYI97563.1 polar amino acid transport system ATP-binding protein [Streptomonospora nanhaiensis]